MEADIGWPAKLVDLQGIYEMYAILETTRGNNLPASQTLAEMSKVPRKLSVTARSMLTKLQCFGMLSRDFSTAAFIINDPSTSDQAIEVLRKHYTPLTEDQISVKNCIIFEYIMQKNSWDKYFEAKVPNLPIPITKRNSTFRMLRNHCDENIAYELNKTCEPLCVWPKAYLYRPKVSLDDMVDEEGDWKYKVYNPAGWTFIWIIMPSTRSIIHNAKWLGCIC